MRSFAQSIAKVSAATIAVATLALAHPAAAADACGPASLTPAVEGAVFLDYGQVSALNADNPPVRSRGVIYATSSAAMVAAPASGYVEFAGTVPNMGHVVVLNIGHDHRVVLAGMAAVSVKAHDIVEADGQVGVMLASDIETPHLYMELRCGDMPVNPRGTMTIAMR
jgi:septal ring factor EnvC (AmiA/AmiB activator)